MPGRQPARRLRVLKEPWDARPEHRLSLELQRLREERRPGAACSRTVASYRCFLNGTQLPGLRGQMVERGGPGDNTQAVGHARELRIRAGLYPLATHAGTQYRTAGCTPSAHFSALARPGLLLQQTGQRSFILIHPGMNCLWSGGCLNPCSGLVGADSRIDQADSRQRVIELIDALRASLGTAFPTAAPRPIPGANTEILGEP